ncbi:MAG TPA: primosomal protein N', partial [Polyangiaceae bacterium]|nr:primosomal protein N' [Polyangiaceae bacterium]
GHDLPAVTLVGVLNADAALSLPDFRAAERTFQLLVQVAGRAGRADQAGRVLIQTRNPEHPAVACAAQHDVRTFVESELEEREEVGHPPFSRAALVRFEGTDEPSVRREAERWGQLAERQAREVRIFPPTPAPLARLRNRYRYHFFLRSTSHTALFEVLRTLARASSPRSIKVSIDVDPMTML